jgi:hypothetical protein
MADNAAGTSEAIPYRTVPRSLRVSEKTRDPLRHSFSTFDSVKWGDQVSNRYPHPLYEYKQWPTKLGQQQALYTALIEKEPRLAPMYLGSLAVIRQHDNPDRLAFAAHGLRELMEKLPRYFNVPAQTQPDIQEKLRMLVQTWDHVVSRSKCHDNGKWNGPIDDLLRGFLNKIASFFELRKQHILTRKQSAAKLLRALEPL